MRRAPVGLVLVACAGAPPRGPGAERQNPVPADARSDHGTEHAGSRPEGAGAAPGDSVKVTLADVGLERGSLDRSVEPCVDFYQFACGGWLAAHPSVPASATPYLPDTWSRRDEIHDRALTEIERALRAESAAAPALQAARELYAGCVDHDAIDAHGMAPFTPILARVRDVATTAKWTAAISELQRLGADAVWSVERADPKASSGGAVSLGAPALGLTRDAYVEPGRSATVEVYRAAMARLLEIATASSSPRGTAPATSVAERARAVVALEIELAKLSAPAATPVRWSRARIARATRSIAWTAYWKARGAEPGELVIATPALFERLDDLRRRFAPAVWADYFTARVLQRLAIALPRRVAAAVAELDPSPWPSGTPSRGRRCVDEMTVAVPEAIEHAITALVISDDGRRSAEAIVDTIRQALAARIRSASWVAEPTRRATVDRLTAVTQAVGVKAPRGAPTLAVRRDAFAESWIAALSRPVPVVDPRVGDALGHTPWVDASVGHLIVPASVLQPPVFGDHRTAPANVGGMAMLVAGALVRDALWRGFDVAAQPADRAAHAARERCLGDQYATFEVAPKLLHDPHLTSHSDIADLAATEAAFDAYRTLRAGASPRYVAEGLTEDQQFFVAVAQSMCTVQAGAARRTELDGTTLAKFRIYGALRNHSEFATAFACPAGTPMRPAQRCSIW